MANFYNPRNNIQPMPAGVMPRFTKPQGYQPMATGGGDGVMTSMPQKPPFAGVMPIGPGRGYPTMMPPVGIGGGLAFGSGYGSPGLGLVPGAQMGAVRNLQAQMPLPPRLAGLGDWGMAPTTLGEYFAQLPGSGT